MPLRFVHSGPLPDSVTRAAAMILPSIPLALFYAHGACLWPFEGYFAPLSQDKPRADSRRRYCSPAAALESASTCKMSLLSMPCWQSGESFGVALTTLERAWNHRAITRERLLAVSTLDRMNRVVQIPGMEQLGGPVEFHRAARCLQKCQHPAASIRMKATDASGHTDRVSHRAGENHAG